MTDADGISMKHIWWLNFFLAATKVDKTALGDRVRV